METLLEEIISLATAVGDKNIVDRFINRARQGLLTRDENNKSHFCVYFLPFNPRTKEFFIVHHKKSGLWISPGGHIDKGEDLLTALNREIKEELGMNDFFKELPKPFLLSITPIENPIQTCKEHLDIWFLLETDGTEFKVDPKEFYNVKWLSFLQSKEVVTDASNILALRSLHDKSNPI